MTDYYPQEEGAVFDEESYIIPCYPDGAVTELSSVKPGTTVAGRISVAASTALGDGWGIAIRAATGAGAPARIPILFYGVVKVTDASTAGYLAYAGSFAINSITTTYATEFYSCAELKPWGGTHYIMGMWLQGSGVAADECLLLVGKCL